MNQSMFSAFVEFSILLLAAFSYFHLGNAKNWERISWLENYPIAMVTKQLNILFSLDVVEAQIPHFE